MWEKHVVSRAWLQCENERVAGRQAEISRQAYIHVVAELKRPCMTNPCTEDGHLISFILWAWGTATTARDKRDAFTVVLIHRKGRANERVTAPVARMG